MNFTINVNRPKDTIVVGRNGYWQSHGLEVMHTSNETITLTPVGKRGILRAGFSIPIEAMDELCDKWLKNRDPKALRKMRKAAKNP